MGNFTYVLTFECPHCEKEPSVLEEHDFVPIDQDINWNMRYCPMCGEKVEDPGSYVVEEYRIPKNESEYNLSYD